MVEWKKIDGQHRIVDFKGQNENSAYLLQWNFFEADYFLIVEREYSNMTMQQIKETLEKKLNENMTVLKHLGVIADGSWKFFLLSKSKFLAANNKYTVTPANLMRGIIQFMVFACEKREDGLIVYYPETPEECAVFKKTKVHIEIKENRGIFGLGKHKITLQIPYVEGYQDYGLCYKISNLPYLYPITREMMGKSVEIMVPRKETVEVKVSPEGKDLYQLR